MYLFSSAWCEVTVCEFTWTGQQISELINTKRSLFFAFSAFQEDGLRHGRDDGSS